MPRQRSKTAAKKETASTASEVQTDSNTQERKIKMPMTPDQIRAVYAKRRTKGLYTELLVNFIESGEGGVSVKEEWPVQFSDKKATTLKQGFENAKDKKDAPEGAELIDVIVDGEDVFLLNRAVLGGDMVEAEAVA